MRQKCSNLRTARNRSLQLFCYSSNEQMPALLNQCLPSETKLDSHDKKHNKTWKILPRSCHVTLQENIKTCTNLYDLCMAIKKQDLGRISKKD